MSAARESVDRMMARGVRAALIGYARTLEDAIDQGVLLTVLVEEGIPRYDIERVLENRADHSPTPTANGDLPASGGAE